MARSAEMQNPEVRKLWWFTMIVQVTLGFTNGLYLYTYGPYFYEKFGGSIDPSTAMLLTTVLLGLRQGLVALLEFPTGALADTIGRTHVVILSWIMRVTFFLFLAFIWICHSPTSAFAWAIFASITFALNYTFFNGAFSAWCAEVLQEKAPTVQYSWLASRFYSYQNFMIMVGGVVAIFLYSKQLAYVGFILAAFLSFCVMGYCMLRMREVKSLHFLDTHRLQMATVTKRIGETLGKSFQICWKSPAIFWVVFTFGSYMFLLNLVMYLWPVYFQSLSGTSANHTRNWMAIVVITQILSFAGGRMLVVLNKRWSKDVKSHLTGYRRIFTFVTVAAALSILAFSMETMHWFSGSFMFPSSVIIVCMAFGIAAPCYEILVNAYLPREDAQNRATVLSAGSMLRSFLVLLLAVPSGGTSSEKSPIYWSIPAALLLVSAIVAHFTMKRASHKLLAEAPIVPEEGLAS